MIGSESAAHLEKIETLKAENTCLVAENMRLTAEKMRLAAENKDLRRRFDEKRAQSQKGLKDSQQYIQHCNFAQTLS